LRHSWDTKIEAWRIPGSRDNMKNMKAWGPEQFVLQPFGSNLSNNLEFWGRLWSQKWICISDRP
jgi:hypothetical protein